MPNFNDLLLKLKKDAESVDVAQPDMKSASGGFSTVRFVQRQIGNSALRLAISESKHNDDANDKNVPRVQELLIERGVDMQFIQNYLYYDANGKKISFAAPEGSLHSYIESNKQLLTRDQIKNIIGQLILGLQALHEKNLVHRDLQPANILVTEMESGELFVQIADLDSIIPVRSDGRVQPNYNLCFWAGPGAPPEVVSLMTQGYAVSLLEINNISELSETIKEKARRLNQPILIRVKGAKSNDYYIYSHLPHEDDWSDSMIANDNGTRHAFFESLPFHLQVILPDSKWFKEQNRYLLTCLKEKHNRKLVWSWVFNKENINTYMMINHKAADCYTLGQTLYKLILNAVPRCLSLDRDILNLLSLCRTLPEKRSTMISVREHNFFGETKEQRDEFFTGLRNLQSPYEYIGQNRARAFKPNNNFLLISEEKLEKIIMLADDLNSQFHYFDVIEQHMLDTIPAEMMKASLEGLEKMLKALNREIDVLLMPEFYEILSELQKAANEKYAEIKKQFKPELKDYKKEFEAVFDALENVANLPNSVRKILGAIRHNIRLNELPEQNLLLLVELANVMVLAIKNPTCTAYSERFVEITLKLPTLFPELCQKMLTFSSVRLFANKQLAIVEKCRPELVKMGYQFK